MLQTRDAKRTAQAAVRIAVDLANERLITRAEAVERVSPDHVDAFLHRSSTRARRSRRGSAATCSPRPERLARRGERHPRLRPRQGELWARRRRRPSSWCARKRSPTTCTECSRLAAYSPAVAVAPATALVARQFGKPAVVGVSRWTSIRRRASSTSAPASSARATRSRRRHDGRGVRRKPEDRGAEFTDPYLAKLLSWADGFRRLECGPTPTTPRRRARARLRAQGIGLCRTEHMFFETERLPLVQQMILATRTRSGPGRSEAPALPARGFMGCSARWTACR